MSYGMLLMGKNLDSSGPCGPCILTADEVADPASLEIRCWVNGELRQEESAGQMIFDIPAIIEYWSRLTLEPGDLISTGSPAGVGVFHPDRDRAMLHPGDLVEIEVSGIGRLVNPVVAEPV
jgi:acylpyruvate hydrolase